MEFFRSICNAGGCKWGKSEVRSQKLGVSELCAIRVSFALFARQNNVCRAGVKHSYSSGWIEYRDRSQNVIMPELTFQRFFTTVSLRSFWEDLSGKSWPLAGIPDRLGIAISWQEAVGSFPLICEYLRNLRGNKKEFRSQHSEWACLNKWFRDSSLRSRYARSGKTCQVKVGPWRGFLTGRGLQSAGKRQ